LFTKAIYETALTSEVADRLFSNITNASYASNTIDQSFLATLRALTHKRLPQAEEVRLACKVLYLDDFNISESKVGQCMDLFIPETAKYPVPSRHTINIISTTNTTAGEKMLDVVKRNVGSGKRYLSSYTRRDDLQVFYARKVNGLFYTATDEMNTIIFADKLELKHFHVLQMMIPKYLPRLFAGSPLTEPEIALLKSTGNKSAVEYESLLEGFAKDLDIRAEIIRSKLAGFGSVFERIRAAELRNQIQWHQNDYDDLLTKLRETSNKIQECRYTLAGLECSINDNSNDSEIMEYFMCNKNLTVVKVAGTAIEFIAHGYADIYDVDAFERYVGNHNGYLYSSISSSITKPQMEMLYRAVFGDGLYKLRICAAYIADMKTGLRPFQSYTFPSESRTYFPNTHIQHFGCIGSYAGRFQEYIDRRDYVGAIDQAAVSARNLNFYDSAVMGNFARDFSRSKVKCLEKLDGTLLTPREVIIELEGDIECPDPLF